MSAEAVSRFAAILALDNDRLSDYMSDDKRSDILSDWSDQLDGDKEVDLLESADWNNIYRYIASDSDRPAGGDKRGGGG